MGWDMVLIAGSMDLRVVMAHLATDRPLFHSEADFQLAFAWAVRELDPHLWVRPEIRTPRGERLDVLVRNPTSDSSTALELKYLCASLQVTVGRETFTLPSQGAQDVRGYDVIKDACRVERMVAEGEVSNGAVLVISNDSSYWKRPGHSRATGAADFRLYDGDVITGPRQWGLQSAGTAKYRPERLDVKGHYRLNWKDYSEPSTAPHGMFRWLCLDIRRGSG